MKKSFYVDAPPPRRPLKIFAFDPMLGRTASKRISVEIANEQNLRPGPRGSRVEVIDYDGANECYYAPVDLNDPSILMQGGLKFGIDFKGGTLMTVKFAQQPPLEKIRSAFARSAYFWTP